MFPFDADIPEPRHQTCPGRRRFVGNALRPLSRPGDTHGVVTYDTKRPPTMTAGGRSLCGSGRGCPFFESSPLRLDLNPVCRLRISEAHPKAELVAIPPTLLSAGVPLRRADPLAQAGDALTDPEDSAADVPTD